MKKLLCAFLSAALLASSAVPAFAAETTDSTNTTPVLTEGTYAPNQVIVMFKDSAIDTDSVPKKADIEAVGAADVFEISEVNKGTPFYDNLMKEGVKIA